MSVSKEEVQQQANVGKYFFIGPLIRFIGLMAMMLVHPVFAMALFAGFLVDIVLFYPWKQAFRANPDMGNNQIKFGLALILSSIALSFASSTALLDQGFVLSSGLGVGLLNNDLAFFIGLDGGVVLFGLGLFLSWYYGNKPGGIFAPTLQTQAQQRQNVQAAYQRINALYVAGYTLHVKSERRDQVKVEQNEDQAVMSQTLSLKPMTFEFSKAGEGSALIDCSQEPDIYQAAFASFVQQHHLSPNNFKRVALDSLSETTMTRGTAEGQNVMIETYQLMVEYDPQREEGSALTLSSSSPVITSAAITHSQNLPSAATISGAAARGGSPIYDPVVAATSAAESAFNPQNAPLPNATS